MATGAADGFRRCVFEGCISASDAAKEQRPYHRNCGCALHDKRGCVGASPCRRSLSYPIRRSWSGTHLAAIAGSAHSSSPTSTPGDSSDAKALKRPRSYADRLVDLDL